MRVVSLTVDNVQLSLTPGCDLSLIDFHNTNQLFISIDMSDIWKGIDKTIIFLANNKEYKVSMNNRQDSYAIPKEVLKASEFEVYLIGIGDDLAIRTNTIHISAFSNNAIKLIKANNQEQSNDLISYLYNARLADPTSEPHIVINEDRTIIVPEQLQRIGVQYDHNIETVTFDCPRYWDDHDMSKMKIYVVCQPSNGEISSIICDNIVVDETDDQIMHFDWTISRSVTNSEGKIRFLVCAKRTDEKGNESVAWNTEINDEMHVSEGILSNNQETIQEYPDLVTRMLEIVESFESGGNTGNIGSLDELLTDDKSSIVSAINELYAMLSGTINLNSAVKLKECKFKLISSTTDVGYNSTAEAQKNFDDSQWESVKIPHDYSIYNSFNQSSQSGYTGGFLDGGDSWYRFKLDTRRFEGQRLYIYFDGIYMESDVYINGIKVKDNKWYNPFYVDITDYISYDNEDLLAVFVRNRQPSSRWYSGSGIIRNIYLMSANDIEIGIHDIHVTTPTLEEDIKTNTANTRIDFKVKSKIAKTITVQNDIYFGNSLIKSSSRDVVLQSGTNAIVDNIKVDSPILWDEYKGNIYTLKTYIKNGPIVYHYRETNYGYRYFKFDKDTGFWLNGKNIKLRGVCMHHDLGCIGAEINRSAVERQVDSLIKIGVNAIRLTHNPSSSEYLNVCAEKGVLLIEEMFDCWIHEKITFDFSRFYNKYSKDVIENTVNRGKNNPAIIMWSLGNEIIQRDKYTPEEAETFVRNMSTLVKNIDTERPITMGEANVTFSETESCYKELDVIGVNYGNNTEYETIRSKFPDKCIYGSETTSALSTRGIYQRSDNDRHLSSFDDNKVDWGEYAATDLKKHMHDLSYLAGMFVWTGWDYIGEPTPYSTYPSKSSNFGIYDTCGFPKDIAYMYQSRWTDKPMIHILPHWDWESGSKKVWLYSNCHKVELFLNGKSLGKKMQSDIGNKYQFEYFVEYKKGTLVANGYDESDEVVAQDVVYTSQGAAVKAKLSSDKTSVNVESDDLVFITCDLTDSNGVLVPRANNKITFSVIGGTVVGTDNGNPPCVEKYRINSKTAFNGKVLCVVKHDGESGSMIIKASGEGLLEESTISVIKSKQTVLTPETENTFIDATNPPIYDYGEEPDINDGLLYELREPTTLNGIDQSIDTEIQLFDTNKDSSIFIDFRSDAEQQTKPDYDDRAPVPVIHSILEQSPWPGIDISIHTHHFMDNESGLGAERGQNVPDKNKLGIFANSLSLGIPYNSTEEHKIIIVNSAADGKVTVYDKLGKIGEIEGELITATHSTKVTLGACVHPSGDKNRWWTGTINKCSIWSRQLTQTEIVELLK